MFRMPRTGGNRPILCAMDEILLGSTGAYRSLVRLNLYLDVRLTHSFQVGFDSGEKYAAIPATE